MKQVYFNGMQREVMAVGANTSVVVAGRGTGKGLLQAAWNLRNFQAMPRSTTAFVVPNSKRAKTNTLPSMFIHWESWGYKRDLHWCVGRRPPKRLGWQTPLFMPESWENVISFYNGSIGILISQERKGTSNSISFDAIAADEAKFLDYQQLKEETLPANRGNARHFGECPWHHGIFITSDMPLTKKGSWFLDYESKQDPALIEVLQGILFEIAAINCAVEKGEEIPPYRLKRRRQLEQQLNELRRHAVFFKSYSSLTNLEILGEKWLMQQKRDLPPLVFQTSILCLPVEIMKDGFYSNMTPGHKYHASDHTALARLGFPLSPVVVDSSLDADVNRDAPLCIAFDYNANINWMVVGQADYEHNRLLVVRSFFVKYERKLPELLDDFHDYYYNNQRLREVIYYYDQTARGSNYAINKEDFQWYIYRTLTSKGWKVENKYIGRALPHHEKHLIINRGFAGKGGLVPYFNIEGNEYLLISIQTAGVYNGKKDKRGEKLAETEEDKLEARTDGSDAFDTLYIGCTKAPYRKGISGVLSGIN